MCEVNWMVDEEVERPGITEFVHDVVVAITHAKIFWSDHPRVQALVDGMLIQISNVFSEIASDQIILGVSDGCLFFQKRPLLGPSLSASRLLTPMEALGSGGLLLTKATQRRDIISFIEFMSQEVEKVSDYRTANAALATSGCQTVRFLASYSENEVLGSLVTTGEFTDLMPEELALNSLEVPVELYHGVVDVLSEAMVNLCRGKHFELDRLRASSQSVLERLMSNPKDMLNVCLYEKYDAFTFGHSVRVCFLAMNFASHLTQDRELLERIGSAALLHDIGKAWIPLEILHCKTRLSDEQRLEMNKHTVYGGRILLELGEQDPVTVAAAFGHHRTEHGGYPEAWHPARLSTITKLIKICDVYEALTAVRPYKPSMSSARAYRIMMSMEGHFDPQLLRRFIQVNGIYPIGTRVRLNNNDIVTVESQGQDLERPVVSLDGYESFWDLSQSKADIKVTGRVSEESQEAEEKKEAESSMFVY